MELQGKIVNFLGDSITQGACMEDCMHLCYHQVIARDYGLKQANAYGVGGTRIAYQRKVSASPKWDLYFAGRAFLMDTQADIVVVYGGVNDWIHGDAPVGEIGDKYPSTFCGGVRYLMDYLTNTYKGKTVVFVTPARCNFHGNSSNNVSNHAYKQADAQPLKWYVDVIKKTGEMCNIPVLDLYDGLGIDPNNQDDEQTYTADGLHFNANGHAKLAKIIGEFLSAL